MSGKRKTRHQIENEGAAFTTNIANNGVEGRKRQNKRWEDLGQRICSLKPEDFCLITGSKTEISADLTSAEVISNVLGFLNAVKRDVGSATDGTILSKTEELAAKICDVDKETVIYIELLAKKVKEGTLGWIVNSPSPVRSPSPTRPPSPEPEFITRKEEIITAHEKEILQEQLREMEERSRLARDRRNWKPDAPGNQFLEPTPIVQYANEVLNIPIGRKRKAPKPPNAEIMKRSKEAEIQVVQNPFWKQDLGLGRLAKTADRASKLSRAIAEENEKKRKKEEEIREKKEKQWAQLGEVICSLSLDDFVIPPGSAVEPEEKSDCNLPLNLRGERVVTAVATFVHSIKGLLGEKLIQDTIFSDQHRLTSALTGINHSTTSKRFSCKGNTLIARMK